MHLVLRRRGRPLVLVRLLLALDRLDRSLLLEWLGLVGCLLECIGRNLVVGCHSRTDSLVAVVGVGQVERHKSCRMVEADIADETDCMFVSRLCHTAGLDSIADVVVEVGSPGSVAHHSMVVMSCSQDSHTGFEVDTASALVVGIGSLDLEIGSLDPEIGSLGLEDTAVAGSCTAGHLGRSRYSIRG